ncbi:MAG: hypothetical protein QM790_02840 [Nibricoccus sp.]
MKHLRIHLFLAGLISLVVISAYAEEKALLPEKEEDIPVEFIPTLDTTVSVGMRRLNKGPQVRFGNLGSMPQPSVAAAEDYKKTSANFVGHGYTDGYVLADALGTYERDGLGKPLTAGVAYENGSSWKSVLGSDGIVTVYTQIYTAPNNQVNGVYVPDTTTTPGPDGTVTQTLLPTWASTLKFVGYNADRSRSWSVLNKSQISADGKSVSMHADGVISAGASLKADSSGSTGFDLSFERRLGRRGKLEWGVTGGFKFGLINAKAAGVFPAYLLRTTDVYKLDRTFSGGLVDESGQLRNPSTQQPGDASDLKFLKFYGGGQVYQYVDSATLNLVTTGGDQSKGTSVDVSDVNWGTATIVGEVMIHGNYQLKGAYYFAQFGPTLRYRFNDRWSVSTSAGLALAWVGTRFRATEFYNTWNDLPEYEYGSTTNRVRVDLEGNQTEYHLTESNDTHKFIPGYYFEFNAEYWATERTGFFAGVTGQGLRKYNQNRLGDQVDPRDRTKVIPGRTATVDFGETIGWRMGIMTRF